MPPTPHERDFYEELLVLAMEAGLPVKLRVSKLRKCVRVLCGVNQVPLQEDLLVRTYQRWIPECPIG
jgi:hypothetical protein